jgi:thiamine pyrophosphokinase
MVSDNSTIFAVTETTDIECGEGRSVSVFSPDNSLRIKSDGLKWPLDDVVFDNWWKATLNRATKDTVHLELSHKSIALIILN